MKTWLFAIAITALVACGGNDDDKSTDGNNGTNTATGGLSISVSPTSVTLQPGGRQYVTVTIARSGKVTGASVSVSVSNAPDGVIATLDSDATTGASDTVTITALSSAQPSTGSITVTASALAIDPRAITSATIAVVVGAPPSITVTGRVVAASLAPLSGVTVDVWSHGSSTPQRVTTTASGTFTASGVIAPYDVKLSSLAAVNGLQALWLGLTRTDPLLTVLPAQQGSTSGSYVKVDFSGGLGFPQPVSTVTAYTVGCPAAGASNYTSSTTDTRPLEGAIIDGRSCTINALQHNNWPGFADTLFFGTVNFFPAASGSVEQSVSLGTISLPMHDVTVTANTASGSPLSHAFMMWNNQQRVVQLGDVTGDLNATTIKAPADEALGVVMVFNTNGDGIPRVNSAKHLSAGVTDITVTVPQPPSVVSPAGGSSVDGATLALSIEGALGSGYIYAMNSATSASKQFYVATMDTTLQASVLSDHGMIFESSDNFSWQYYTFSNIASADDLASPQATPNGYLQTDGASYSVSVSGSFTVQ